MGNFQRPVHMAFNREKGSPALWRHLPSHGILVRACPMKKYVHSNLNEENPMEVGKKKKKKGKKILWKNAQGIEDFKDAQGFNSPLSDTIL